MDERFIQYSQEYILLVVVQFCYPHRLCLNWSRFFVCVAVIAYREVLLKMATLFYLLSSSLLLFSHVLYRVFILLVSLLLLRCSYKHFF